MAELENKNDVQMSDAGIERLLVPIRRECAEDFTLPDYMGDVKRLLRSAARVIPVSKFVGDNEVSFLNTVSFSVLYIDSDNELTEASFSKDFEYNEKVSEGTCDAYMMLNQPVVSVRLSGPRKICAKASITGEICVTDMEIPQKCRLSQGAEIKESTVYIHSAEFVSTEEREYAEELCRLEEVGSDEVEAVAVFCDPAPALINLGDGGISISSKAKVKAILRVDGELTHAECELPIALNIDAPISCECFPSADVVLTECKVNFNEQIDSVGVMTTSAVVTVGAKINARIDSNKPCEVINDAFMPAMDNECVFTSVKYDSAVSLHNESIDLDFTVAGKENGQADILYYECSPSYYSVEVNENTAEIKGEISYLAVVMGNDGVPDSVKGVYPLDVLIKLPVTRKRSKMRHNISVVCNSASIDGDNLRFCAAIGASFLMLDEMEECILESLSYIDKEQKHARNITVYYPERGESVWDISKKYAIRGENIIAENPDAFDSGMGAVAKRIIIVDA